MFDPELKIIRDEQELINIVRSYNNTKNFVTTNGCFDLLHLGHLKTLFDAKKQGDVLFVGVNSDDAVSYLKGPNKPFNNENCRALQVAFQYPVNWVYIINDVQPNRFIEIIKPAVHVKGGDYKVEELVEYDEVIKNGGRIYLSPLIEFSSVKTDVKCYK